MTEETMLNDRIELQGNYVTTSALARFCGVSRFTIINWVNQGKIKTIKTPGGHRRIPFSEVISFLGTLHKNEGRKGALPGRVVHCWEYAENNGGKKKCINCLISKKNVDFCFSLVKHFGKDAIGCGGDCLNCSYFKEFVGKNTNVEKRSTRKKVVSSKSRTAVEERGKETKNIVEPISHIAAVSNAVELERSSATPASHSANTDL